jgi:hypothetical protein
MIKLKDKIRHIIDSTIKDQDDADAIYEEVMKAVKKNKEDKQFFKDYWNNIIE